MIKFISSYLRRLSSYLAIFSLSFCGIFLFPFAAFADEMVIELDANTPYVDVVIDVATQTNYTVVTNTGVRNETVDGRTTERVAWVDSWLWLYPGVATPTNNVAIAADDDSNHSQNNIFASRLSGVIEAGTYTIRATSYDYVVAGVCAVGTYTLVSNLIVVQPVVEPTPEPTPTPAPTPEPIPTPPPVAPPVFVYDPPIYIPDPPPLVIAEPELPPVVIELPPIPIELPPIPVELPPVVIELPPIPIELPPAVIELPPIQVELPPLTPADLPELIPLAPPLEALVAHIQEDIANVENGGIAFFGTQSQPQVVGEDGQLTPAPPSPGSGDYLDPRAITITETFIGQPGGVTFNAPDVAVPVEPIILNIEIPGVGQAAQAVADAYVAMANIGNDMSPITRKKAKAILVTTILGSVLIRRFP